MAGRRVCRHVAGGAWLLSVLSLAAGDSKYTGAARWEHSVLGQGPAGPLAVVAWAGRRLCSCAGALRLGEPATSLTWNVILCSRGRRIQRAARLRLGRCGECDPGRQLCRPLPPVLHGWVRRRCVAIPIKYCGVHFVGCTKRFPAGSFVRLLTSPVYAGILKFLDGTYSYSVGDYSLSAREYAASFR